jgi:hypothetical protein
MKANDDAPIVEIPTGFAKSLFPGRSIKAINVADPAIADATIISANGGVVVNGQAVGITMLTVYDEKGTETDRIVIQVVSPNDLRDNPPAIRSHIRVRSLANAQTDRMYLCERGCTQIPIPPGSPPTVGARTAGAIGDGTALGALIGEIAEREGAQAGRQEGRRAGRDAGEDAGRDAGRSAGARAGAAAADRRR